MLMFQDLAQKHSAFR